MKILGLTSIRSDYDLLSPLFGLLHRDADIDFRILVSGAHLSSTFGNTVTQIERDGFPILAKIETLINSDSSKSKLKTASLLLQNAIDIIDVFSPDLLIYSGDREDVIMYALIGTFLKIPTIHFYGGDHEQGGHEDTVVRHATSKLSTWHFVAHESHQRRLLKMGERAERIANIGAISLDRFNSVSVMRLSEISTALGIDVQEKPVVVIYHPSPDAEEDDALVLKNILQALEEKGLFAFVSYPNTDHNYDKIIAVMTKYSAKKEHFYFFKNLERDLFLSIFKQAAFLIGNSSAGIYEAASVPMAAINVGKRQTGRSAGKNVVFCGSDKAAILASIEHIETPEFVNGLTGLENMYGDGHSAQKAYDLIKTTDFARLIAKIEDPLC